MLPAVTVIRVVSNTILLEIGAIRVVNLVTQASLFLLTRRRGIRLWPGRENWLKSKRCADRISLNNRSAPFLLLFSILIKANNSTCVLIHLQSRVKESRNRLKVLVVGLLLARHRPQEVHLKPSYWPRDSTRILARIPNKRSWALKDSRLWTPKDWTKQQVIPIQTLLSSVIQAIGFLWVPKSLMDSNLTPDHGKR